MKGKAKHIRVIKKIMKAGSQSIPSAQGILNQQYEIGNGFIGNNNSQSMFDNLVTVEKVAEYLATTERHIMDLVRAGKLPARAVGRKIRFCMKEIIASTLIKRR